MKSLLSLGEEGFRTLQQYKDENKYSYTKQVDNKLATQHPAANILCILKSRTRKRLPFDNILTHSLHKERVFKRKVLPQVQQL